ncbi:MAG TPA: S1 family peptidase [Jatrophihabitans sp.]|uniref:S1 family peptidase n=1 Tax=Jatrophihabitans sp. TaxID=1932789 RepID=UPI002EECF1A7
MRPIPIPSRTCAIAVAVSTLAAGALLTAPAIQAAPPTTAAASAVSATSFRGGDPIPGTRCTIGFNVRDSSNVYYFLTSRRCGVNVGYVFYTDSSRTTVLGTTVGISPSNKDYAIVRYASGISHPGAVNTYNGASQDITSAATAYVGEPVKRSGSVTGVRSGSVTATNVTVYYAEGALIGMIKTNICSESGDSGGPLFDGAKAIGLASGSSGNCSSGGTTFFQPVTEPLAVYGVTVY